MEQLQLQLQRHRQQQQQALLQALLPSWSVCSSCNEEKFRESATCRRCCSPPKMPQQLRRKQPINSTTAFKRQGS